MWLLFMILDRIMNPDWIFDPELTEADLAWGDIVARNDAFMTVGGKGVLMEWKRSTTDVDVGGVKQMKFPLRHLACTSENKWALQLAVTALLVERVKRRRVDSYVAAVFHPDRPNYQIVRMPNLDQDARTLVAWHSAALSRRAGKPAPKRPRSGGGGGKRRRT